MLVLTTYKLFAIRRMSNARPGALITTLLRDGIWAYFVVFGGLFLRCVTRIWQC